jgi:pSer/pThr/pTyr-binding forkhead associated (FHA) protein
LRDWYLEVRRDGAVAETVDLEGELATLGRATGSTVRFPSDDAVSKLHAVLEHSAEGWRLRDAGSSNGTFLNGRRLDGEQLLRAGDEIGIGTSRVMMRSAAQTAGADQRTSRLAEPPTAPAGSETSVASQRTAPQGGYLDLTEEWRAGGGGAAPAPEPPAPTAPAPARPAPMPTPSRIDAGDAARRGSAHVRGAARAVQLRRDQDEQDVLVFRVDRYDSSGNRVGPVAVEFQGYRTGQVGEGEEVEVHGKWSRGTLQAKRVTNLSTGSEVRGMGGASKLILALVYLAVFAFFAFLIFAIVTG